MGCPFHSIPVLNRKLMCNAETRRIKTQFYSQGLSREILFTKILESQRNQLPEVTPGAIRQADGGNLAPLDMPFIYIYMYL